mmetsp:Transcript_81/g.122  ORF Transcript_81/g.122 Transcript_81/m.122 type:complete len:106 (+) Transcript_81:283-600(+)
MRTSANMCSQVPAGHAVADGLPNKKKASSKRNARRRFISLISATNQLIPLIWIQKKKTAANDTDPVAKKQKTTNNNNWKSAVDPKTGRTYYYDRETRVTQWEKPY